jgi:hypothetical protein
VIHLTLLAVALSAAAAPSAQTPTGGPYALTRQLVAGGGERVSGGAYVLVGSIGQAATGQAGAGSATLEQGFHRSTAGAPLPDMLFQNGFE